MAIPCYLAMAEEEIARCTSLPEKMAWLSCRFSRTDRGIDHLPPSLPAGSLIVLDDSLPPAGHDPARILRQLDSIPGKSGVLLDFQRPSLEENRRIARALAEGLSCPVCISELYADNLRCPVFLSPVPPEQPLAQHLSPWAGREIWLDAAMNAAAVTVTADGSRFEPAEPPKDPSGAHREETLHCHYTIDLQPDVIRFTLFRTRADLDALLAEAARLGVRCAVGLYQQLSGT